MEAARATPPIPEALAEATRHQPRARAALVAALASPGHAYIFRGPRGAGKAAAARAFAAELLAEGASDPDDARRRALLDPSPHPDLAWLRPPGAQHLVEDVRESVIRASSLSPAEGRRRVFVIEEAEDLRDESQNALLKTLEEPAPFAHLILICSEPEQLAETILSRCAPVEFGPLAPDAVLEALGAGAEGEAAARLSGGDVELARLLVSEPGAALRGTAEAAARAARSPQPPPEPWRGLLEAASRAGEEAGAEEEKRLLEEAEAMAKRGRKEQAHPRGDRAGEADREAGPHPGTRPRPRDLLRLVPGPGGRRVRGRRRGAERRPPGGARRGRGRARSGPGAGGGRVGPGHPPAAAGERLGGTRPRGALAPPRRRTFTTSVSKR